MLYLILSLGRKSDRPDQLINYKFPVSNRVTFSNKPRKSQRPPTSSPSHRLTLEFLEPRHRDFSITKHEDDSYVAGQVVNHPCCQGGDPRERVRPCNLEFQIAISCRPALQGVLDPTINQRMPLIRLVTKFRDAFSSLERTQANSIVRFVFDRDADLSRERLTRWIEWNERDIGDIGYYWWWLGEDGTSNGKIGGCSILEIFFNIAWFLGSTKGSIFEG